MQTCNIKVYQGKIWRRRGASISRSCAQNWIKPDFVLWCLWKLCAENNTKRHKLSAVPLKPVLAFSRMHKYLLKYFHLALRHCDQ